MPNREHRAEIARQTLAILEQGFYTSPSGNGVEIAPFLNRARAGSVLYTPHDFNDLYAERDRRLAADGERRPTFQVFNGATLEAAEQLAAEGERILALNFASAKNPGGGFLSGSQAQEESLARATGLYSCLLARGEMYGANRRTPTCLYTDHMIYSPDVPVFRDADDRLLEKPYGLSFLTAPAVNAGAVGRNEPEKVKLIEPTMISRIEKVLSVAVVQGHDVLILGAWGCGVFENVPADVARWFALHLIDGRFRRAFRKVVFAVLDGSAGQKTITPFARIFS